LILARHSLETDSPPGSVWHRWADVGTWPDWDRSLEAASLEGPFQPSTRGHLRLQNGRTLAFTIASLDPGQGFLLEVALQGTRLFLDHRLDPCPRGTRITLEIRMNGWLAWFHARRLGASLQGSLPPALRALARIAERPL
jgi:hypothetical protein